MTMTSWPNRPTDIWKKIKPFVLGAVAAGGGNKPYATVVVAATDSVAADAANADHVCNGTDDQDTINTAITEAAAGPSGGRVELLEGTYHINGAINMAAGVSLTGQGRNTHLRLVDGFDAFVRIITCSSIANIRIADLRIDGNKANQASSNQRGIYFTGVTDSEVENVEIHDCFGSFGIGVEVLSSSLRNEFRRVVVYDCDGYGFDFESSSNYNRFSGCVSRDNGSTAYYLDACDYNVLDGCFAIGGPRGVNLSDSDFNAISGGQFVDGTVGHGVTITDGEHNIVVGVECVGNAEYGIHVNFVSAGIEDNTLVGNICKNNGIAGILLDDAHDCTVTGNTCENNTTYGIQLSGATYNAIVGNTTKDNIYGIYLAGTSPRTQYNGVVGNTVKSNSQEGIYVADAHDNTIVGNTVVENGQDTNNTYDGIFLTGNSDRNNIQSNTVRHGGLANQHRYGINVSAATCDDNFVTNNDLLDSGATGSLNDAGTGTVTTAGNRT